ncbi:hypothetical protein JaAD80_21070 [Janthinobacterium sp. AD80]|nr:hypothetical protein JaAD80_21070 [Janthinobacterium sp. AD80]
MGIAQRIIDGDGNLLAVRAALGHAERHHGRHFRVRVEIDFRIHLGGGLRLHVRLVDLQGHDGAGGDLAVDVDRVAGQLGQLGVDDETVLVDLELAIARILDGAIDAGTEETAAIDGDIEGIRRRFQVALGKLLGDLRDRHADPRLVAAHAIQRVGINVGELRLRLLETHGGRVGDVVTDDVQRFGGAIQAAQALLERHCVLLVDIRGRGSR